MESSASATAKEEQQADNFDIAIYFDSLCLSSNNDTTAAALDSSDKLQEIEVINEERKGLWPNFDNLQVIQEFIAGGTDKLQETQVINEERKGLWPNFDNLQVIQEFIAGGTDKLQETQVINEERKGLWPKSDNSQVIQEFIPGETEWSSSSSVPPKNIWARQNFCNGEKTLPENRICGQGSSVHPLDYKYMNYAPDSSYGYLRDQTNFKSFHANSSIYRSPNQFGGNSVLNYPSGLCNPVANVINSTGNFSPVMENHIVNDQFLGNIGSGYYNSVGNYQESSPYLQDQNNVSDHGSPLGSSLPGFDFFAMAISPEGSQQLQRVLQQGNSGYIDETLRRVFPSIFRLMNDLHGHRIFETLVDNCENYQLYAIVRKLQWESDLFLDATFCDFGSRSIQRLIKRLKRTGMESTITSILSRRSYDLMTDKTASHVIQQCFQYLGDEANKILHDHILSYFLRLATDRVGCITVNVCIDTITGSRRAALLNLVANNASYLSNDPLGNYVLQRVLGLNNDSITQKICYSLKGQYVELAQRKNGSHVVEKCLKSSQLGLSLVIQEIFDNDKTLLLLARDQFGNYVIQTALKLLKLHARDLYEAIVEALNLHSNLLHKSRGKYVCNLIKADLECESAKSDQ